MGSRRLNCYVYMSSSPNYEDMKFLFRNPLVWCSSWIKARRLKSRSVFSEFRRVSPYQDALHKQFNTLLKLLIVRSFDQSKDTQPTTSWVQDGSRNIMPTLQGIYFGIYVPPEEQLRKVIRRRSDDISEYKDQYAPDVTKTLPYSATRYVQGTPEEIFSVHCEVMDPTFFESHGIQGLKIRISVDGHDAASYTMQRGSFKWDCLGVPCANLGYTYVQKFNFGEVQTSRYSYNLCRRQPYWLLLSDSWWLFRGRTRSDYVNCRHHNASCLSG